MNGVDSTEAVREQCVLSFVRYIRLEQNRTLELEILK